MGKKLICTLLFLLLLTTPVRAAEVPEEVTDAVPQQAEELLGDLDSDGTAGSLQAGLAGIWDRVSGQAGDILRERLKNIVGLLLVVLLCGVVDGTFQSVGSRRISNYTPMAGALSITLLSAGSLHSLIGLGTSTMEELSVFSKALLPTLAAATAASGSITGATFRQVFTVFFVDLLLNLVNGLLVPMVYLYICALTASVMLPGNSLEGVAQALKKIITWTLTSALLVFTGYLTITGVVAGSADAMTVKLTKMTISSVVPVVGSILSEATETVLAGAGILRNTIGVFGMLAVLAACVLPFLQLGIQYLLYKLAAFVSGTVGAPPMVKLLSGLGGAFGLVLGMTGTCALLLIVSIVSSVAAVVP